MVGIELRARSGSYLAALADQGVLALPAGSTVMRFLPPLVISEADIETVIEKVGIVLAD
jgi:acetylornithine/LysW-gamma-L-lysine aminotransferase